MDQLTREASHFFDTFVAAFATFEGESVARLFTFPYMAVNQDGTRRVLAEFKETASYFQTYLDSYKSNGSESCSYRSLEVTPMGERAALAAVTWSLKNAAGAEINTWRESYCVLRHDGQMSAYASIDHAV